VYFPSPAQLVRAKIRGELRRNLGAYFTAEQFSATLPISKSEIDRGAPTPVLVLINRSFLVSTSLRHRFQLSGSGGYEVLPAGNAEEALRLLQNNAGVDLVLSDVVMPGMNGIELAKRIQDKYPHTRVALMTGYSAGEIKRFAGEANPYRIIWKPFKTETLLRMVENVLDSPAKSA